MKISQPRHKTIEKYALYLKSLLIKANHRDFSSVEFSRHGNLPRSFVPTCVKLGYLIKDGNRFISNYDYHSVTTYDGCKIAKNILEYNIIHSENYKALPNRRVLPCSDILNDSRGLDVKKHNIETVSKNDILIDEKVKKTYTINIFGWKIQLGRK